MRTNTSTVNEAHFDRESWLALAAVAVFAVLSLWATLTILSMPTDGWQISYNSQPPPPLANFAGGWETPLRADDQVTAVNGMQVGGGESYSPLPAADWQDGQTLTYSVLRGGQPLEIPVSLRRLDAAGVLRSLWFTVKDSPAEWSWSLIALLVFFLRPRSTAARLMLLAFVPHNVVVKLLWSAITISRNFAPGLVFYVYKFCSVFWGYLFFPAIILLLLSFPQPVFPLTRWPRAVPVLLFGGFLTLTVLAIAFRSEPLATLILIAEAALLLLAFVAALFNARKMAQNAVLRAQATWVIFGFALTFIPVLVVYLLDSIRLIDLRVIGWIFSFTPLVLPACLAIAITRYHLFDIYLIIRRTLQYTLLSGLLALVYFSLVILLQAIFHVLGGISAGGRTQDVTIVLSTLASASLFNPLRRRVQAIIDRRFFRRKYDAERILAGYAVTARNEVTLDTLTGELLHVVDETIQPEQTSVWLMPAQRKN